VGPRLVGVADYRPIPDRVPKPTTLTTWDNDNSQFKPNHRSTGKGTIHESI
jgi:hypothetical protein